MVSARACQAIDVRRRDAEAVVVSRVFPPDIGGSGELLYNIYSRFTGVPVSVWCDGSGVIERVGAMRVIRRGAGGRHWGMLHPSGLMSHFGRTASLIRLAGLGRAVIHCGRLLPEGVSVRMASALTRTPYVCWTHGEELTCQSESRELRMLMQEVMRGAHRVIANSQNTARAAEGLGVPTSKLDVVYPGVDTDRFKPASPDAARLRRELAPNGELIVLTVGRLQRRKGHDLVLRALPEIVARVPVRYVIVGDGEERDRLDDLIGGLRLTEHVRFCGIVPPEELPALYAAADLFVHPNRPEGLDIEGFGMVFLEAAASGVAVIGGASGGVPEAVGDSRFGVLVSGTDVDELRLAMLDLLMNPIRRERLAAAARQRVVDQFSWGRAVSQVMAIHRSASSL